MTNKTLFTYDTAKNYIQKALASIGVKGFATILPTDSYQDRWIIFVNGNRFGIYDLHKCLFVD